MRESLIALGTVFKPKPHKNILIKLLFCQQIVETQHSQQCDGLTAGRKQQTITGKCCSRFSSFLAQREEVSSLVRFVVKSLCAMVHGFFSTILYSLFININNLSDFLCATLIIKLFMSLQSMEMKYGFLNSFLGQERSMELEKQQYLDTFLHIVRSSRTKNEFLKNVQDFDNKFTEAFQGPSFQNKASYESFQSVQQIEVPQKPKNPFINQAEEVKRNYSPSRSNNFMTQGQYNNMTNLLGNNMNKMNIPASRSQQQFFKPPQASKTFHAGFMPKQPQKPTYQYQQTNFPPKSPSYAWPTSQQQLPPYPQYPNYPQSNFEHETKQQYQELRKMMANFNMGDKFMMNFPQGNDQGELSINSHHQPSGIDAHPNEFLTAFTKEEETFGKYFKKLVPYGGKPQPVQQNSRPYMENRINPFANQ